MNYHYFMGKKMVTVQFRVDRDTKEKVEKIFAQLGMSMSAGLKIYIDEIIRRQGIPFAVTLQKGVKLVYPEDK